ncbi:MAG: competence/damage-inducible protein A [Halobacteria archaeon]
MPIASLVTVGDEILAGDILNTNARWLAREMRKRGVPIVRMVTVSDDAETIARAIRAEREEPPTPAFGSGTGLRWGPRSLPDHILVTGGLGATPDDVTRQGVALAFGLKLVRNPEAEALLKARFTGKLLELNMVMATLPEGAEAIQNPAGAAPGFVVENVVVLPGVPREMEAMFPLVADRFAGPPLHTEWLTTNRFEVEITPALEEAVRKFPEVRIGSYPVRVEEERKSKFLVKLKMASTDRGAVERCREFLKGRIRDARQESPGRGASIVNER